MLRVDYRVTVPLQLEFSADVKETADGLGILSAGADKIGGWIESVNALIYPFGQVVKGDPGDWKWDWDNPYRDE